LARTFADRRLRAWLAVVAWAALISFFSTGWFSGEHTGGVLLPILRTLLPSATPDQLLAVHALIRKGAHVFEYTVLGALLVRALREEGLRGTALLAAAVGLGVAYAALDEFHQVFVPSRTPSPHDVVVDAMGVVTGGVLAITRRAGLPLRPAQN
jgi:VanZ family protein